MTGRLLVDDKNDQAVPQLPVFDEARGDELVVVYGKSGPQSGKVGTLTAQQVGDAGTSVVVDATTARTFAATDSIVRFTSASAVTATVQTDAAVPMRIGKTITLKQDGAGQVTVAAAVGVTIRTPETLKTAKQYAVATLIKDAANLWTLCGNLEAA
jgi:hypothetical protein